MKMETSVEGAINKADEYSAVKDKTLSSKNSREEEELS